ncbi:hypothetical protein ABH920_000109 [Catenulispora sp. EB89]|uniref:DinB family protein n=1 Tax=Catenulispora sp. EB89 TaxID=3156257 RepID=UPI003517D566
MSSTSTSPAVWTAPSFDRQENVPSGTERDSLERFLDWHRESLLWKCGGLTGEQLASQPLAGTDLTLLGLVRHMALVERWWFRIQFLGRKELEEIFTTKEDPDGDFHDGTADSAEADFAVFREEVELARQACVGHGLDETFEKRQETLSLRWVYLHMIEEYARHLGHADLLREAIDGATGE